jgi:Flp pilus assembly protein TadG
MAVEFAMVVGPFLFMMFAIIELALVFLVSTTLEAASERASRQIRTGEVQTAGQGAEAFKATICKNMTWVASSCAGALRVDVRTFEQFADSNLPDPVGDCAPPATGKCFNDAALKFEHGGPTDVVIVRAYYQWPLLTPFLSQALARLDGNVAVIMTTQTFRNEPYA